MTNEIKEILDIFKQVDLETDVGGCSNCPRKDKNKTCIGCLNNAKDKLLDYITNLQQENERLKKQYAKEEKKLFHDNEILQQRIDKAIEYVEKYWQKSYLLGTWEFFGSGDELLNILRGDE